MRKIRSIQHPGKTPLLTLKQILQWIPISERSVHRYIDDGKIRAYKLDGMLVFNPEDVAAFLKRRCVGAGPTAEFSDVHPTQIRPYAIPKTETFWVLNDEEAKAFFADCERDENGDPKSFFDDNGDSPKLL